MGTLNPDKDDLAENVLYVTPKSKDLPEPKFVITRKEGNEYVEVETPEPITKVSGYLQKVAFASNSNGNGGFIEQFKIFFKNEEGLSIMSVGFSQLGRDFMNALANFPSGAKKIKMTLYKTKSKKNGKFYDHMDLYADGERVSWKFPYGELPRPTVLAGPDGQPFLENGKQKLIWTDVNNFLKNAVIARFPTDDNISAAESQDDFGKDFPGAGEATPAPEVSDEEDRANDHSALPDAPF